MLKDKIKDIKFVTMKSQKSNKNIHKSFEILNALKLPRIIRLADPKSRVFKDRPEIMFKRIFYY